MTKYLPIDNFFLAATDYSWLLKRGYPEKSAAKLVGDRYRLDKTGRVVLRRGITGQEKARDRQHKITVNLKGKHLYIDGGNVLYTVANYLQGRLVFIANDGLLRDCGELYGRVVGEKIVSRAVELVTKTISRLQAERVAFFLDQGIAETKFYPELQRQFVETGFSGELFLVTSADRELMGKEDGVVVTSDSEIIDALDGPVADLARMVLESTFSIHPLNLADLLAGESIP